MNRPATEGTEPPAASDEAALAGEAAGAAGAVDAAASVVARPAARRLPAGALPAILAVALVVLGAALLVTNLGLLGPEAERVAEAAWPAGLVLAGLGLMAAGERLWATHEASFTVERGETEQAGLVASAGTADLQIGAHEGAGELATGTLPLRKGPNVGVEDHSTTLRLEPGWGFPALRGSHWTVALATEVPWRLNLRSSTGNLDLNLAGLTVAELRLRSAFGDVDLKLPAAGGAELDIGLGFGDLAVSVPDGVEVKVKLRKGALAEVEHDERRFIRLGPNELGTPLYAVAARRCTLTVWLGTGNLHLQ